MVTAVALLPGALSVWGFERTSAAGARPHPQVLRSLRVRARADRPRDVLVVGAVRRLRAAPSLLALGGRHLVCLGSVHGRLRGRPRCAAWEEMVGGSNGAKRRSARLGPLLRVGPGRLGAPSSKERNLGRRALLDIVRASFVVRVGVPGGSGPLPGGHGTRRPTVRQVRARKRRPGTQRDQPLDQMGGSRVVGVRR